MDPLTLGLLGGGAVLGYLGQQQGAEAQRRGMERAQEILNALPLPVLKEYYPEVYQQVVALVPEAEQAVTLGPSAMEGVKVDPALRQAQMNALARIQQIGEEGGMTATDRARLAQIQAEQAAATKGQEGAIMQNLAARGLSGGMSEMVSRQLAAQGEANRAAQQGLDVKAQAEQRALQALMQSGQLGGQIEQQQFGQAAQIAQAKDLINRFNAQNLQNVQSQNVQARNAAQQYNAAQKQAIANQNVAGRNQAQMYNIGLPQQQYQNQLARATGQAGAAQAQGQAAAQQAAGQMQFLGGLMQTGAGLYASQQQQDNFNKWLEAKKQGLV